MKIQCWFEPVIKWLKKSIETVFLILFTSAVVFYFAESIYFQSFSTALRFICLEWRAEIIFLNLCLIFLLETALYLFFHNMGVGFGITSAIACILAIVNELKMAARGEAFTFDDIAVAKEALLVAGEYDLKLSGVDLCVILLVLLLSVLLFIFQRPWVREVNGRKALFIRVGSGLAAAGIFAGVFGNMKAVMGAVKPGREESIYVVSQYYNQNGFLAGLAGVFSNRLQVPENYSPQAVEAISQSVIGKEGTKNPNVIFIMNESLYDVGIIEGLELSRDPLAELWELEEKYAYGQFISPSYGGGTCNVEFEVLTGCAVDELGPNVLPYSEMLHHPFDSLVSFMNENGYYSAALHPNTGAYFNRRNVYAYMGFQDVFFTEEMGELPKEGQYASDRELYDRLIALYEEKEKDDIPFFGYVITMQNHGGYEYEYDGSGIEVLNSGQAKNTRALQTYCNLAASSIEAFQYLIDYFETVDRPTVIIMFGDHSPSVIGSFGYSEEQMLGDSKIPFFRTTPLIVYNNYDLPREDWGYINGYSLASKVMDYCEMKMDSYWAYSLEQDNVPELKGYYNIGQEWIEAGEADFRYTEYKQKKWMMAYDRIFGKNYYGSRKSGK